MGVGFFFLFFWEKEDSIVLIITIQWKAKLDFETATTASDKNPAFLSNVCLQDFFFFFDYLIFHSHPLTLHQPQLKDFLRVSDCSQVSDGGAALVLVSEAGLKSLGKSPADAVEVLTVQVATDNLYQDGPLESFETTKAAASRAYAATGLSPQQIQVAEVHDCFTVAEILMYEALGFAAPGQGVTLIKNGTTTLDGALPVNTGGGLIGFGHPVGATGVKQLLEVAKQLRGEAGAYQVKNKPTVGLAANMGGSDKTAVVSILRRGGGNPRAAL